MALAVLWDLEYVVGCEGTGVLSFLELALKAAQVEFALPKAGPVNNFNKLNALYEEINN